jgi:hypothetical protein
MKWDELITIRFDSLRLKEITGELTLPEQVELDQLTQTLEAEEAQNLAPFFEQKQKEHKILREKLEGAQQENQGLAKLISQQEQLAADARRWLAEFDRRNAQIRQAYNRLTGETFPTV